MQWLLLAHLVAADPCAVTNITAGYEHTCALYANRTVECWGYNNYNQTDVPPGLNGIAVAAGDGYTCALVANRTVKCRGRNGDGQTDVPTGLGNAHAGQC